MESEPRYEPPRGGRKGWVFPLAISGLSLLVVAVEALRAGQHLAIACVLIVGAVVVIVLAIGMAKR